MTSSQRIRRHLIVFSFLAILGLSVAASRVSNAAETNPIRIDAGATMEIATDTLPPNPSFSWVLTKDRKFQSAQRTRFFQTRLAQVGTYTLDVSVQDAMASQNDYRAFTIIVAEPQITGTTIPPPLPPENAPPEAVLKTDPAPIEGKVYVPLDGGIVKFDPSQSVGKISSYDIDLNGAIDSDGDGNPTNDKDTQGTFSEKNGAPIYYYFLPQSQPRIVNLTVSNINTNQSNSTTMEITFGNPPVAQSSVARNPNSPVSQDINGLTVRFIPEVQTESGTQLLYEWDFGDRSKSLLTTPTHTYASEGTYTLGLIVRNIATGDIVYSGTDTVTVSTTIVSSSTASSVSIASTSSSSSSSSIATTSSTSSSASSEDQGSKAGSTLSILKVGLIIFFLLVVAGALYAFLTWVKRKTAGKIGDTFEKMEKSLLKTDAKAAVESGKAEPLKLRKESSSKEEKAVSQNDISDRETSKREFQTQRPPETPLSSAGPVPSWLTKSQTATASTPAPTASKPPVPVTPTPATQTGPVPSWLAKASSAPQPTASAPAPVQPKPASTTPPPTSSAPAGQNGPVPSWLKPKTTTEGVTTQVAPPPPTTPTPSPQPAPVNNAVAPAATTPSTPAAGSNGPVPSWLKPKTTNGTPNPPPSAIPSSAPAAQAPAPIKTPPAPINATVPSQTTPVAPAVTAPAPVSKPTPSAPPAQTAKPATPPPTAVVAAKQPAEPLKTAPAPAPQKSSTPPPATKAPTAQPPQQKPQPATEKAPAQPPKTIPSPPQKTPASKPQVTPPVQEKSVTKTPELPKTPPVQSTSDGGNEDDQPIAIVQADSLSK